MIKLAKIAGIVMAVHVVIFLVVVQPGCQSGPTARPMAEATETGDPGWDDSDFEPEEVDRPRSAPRRPAPEPARTPSDDVADDILSPLPADPVRRAEGGERDREMTTYTVRSGDSLWVIARRHGISVGELMEANNLSGSSVIQPGQELRVPAGGGQRRTTRETLRGQEPPAGTTTYTVERGDSLSVIAQRHGTTVARLRELNNLSSDVIQIGQKLIVPEGGSGSRQRSSTQSRPPADVSDSGERHVVASGETPGGIASQYGVSLDELMRANNISDPRRLRVGQELIIPGGASGEDGERRRTGERSREQRRSEERASEEREPRAVPIEPAEPEPAEEEEEESEDIPLIPVIPERD